MKKMILGVLALFALAPAAFAQTWCEQDCCEESGGTWDSEYEYCENAGSTYSECLSDWCSSDVYGSTGSSSCCGPSFLLAAIGGAAFIAGRRA